jgi:hypothetical protein
VLFDSALVFILALMRHQIPAVPPSLILSAACGAGKFLDRSGGN